MSSVKKKIKALPLIRISALDDKNIKEVWVLNETKPKGVIALEVKNRADGSATVVAIHPTWVPICLTDQVPKQMLVDSPKFRSIISGGFIKLLDPKGVAEILDDPDVAEEISKIRDKTADFYKETMPTQLEMSDSVSVVVLDLMSRESNNSIPENEAREILNNREEELSDTDLEYLIKNSSLAKVKKWAADTLADRESEQ
jgi:hypothetical protein